MSTSSNNEDICSKCCNEITMIETDGTYCEECMDLCCNDCFYQCGECECFRCTACMMSCATCSKHLCSDDICDSKCDECFSNTTLST